MVTPEALHIRLDSWDTKTPVTITTPPDAPTGTYMYRYIAERRGVGHFGIRPSSRRSPSQ